MTKPAPAPCGTVTTGKKPTLAQNGSTGSMASTNATGVHLLARSAGVVAAGGCFAGAAARLAFGLGCALGLAFAFGVAFAFAFTADRGAAATTFFLRVAMWTP